MKKIDQSIWIFPLPSGLEIRLSNVPQEDLDFLNDIEQKTARVVELEAVLRECREELNGVLNGKYSGNADKAIAKIDEVLAK